MNPINLFARYLAQVYKYRPAPEEFIIISSHHLQIPESGKLVFPESGKPESTNIKTRYYITGISIHTNNNNLVQQPNDRILKIICGGQTWISGQLGLLDTAQLKGLIIPLPTDDVAQEIEFIIQDNTPKKSQILGSRNSLKFDVVVAPNFHGENLPCYQQIIYPLPETGIIYDGRNRLVSCLTNRIARIEIYVPEDLDYQPVIYCNNLAMKPSFSPEIRNGEPIGATLHNPVSGTAPKQNPAYKIYSVDSTRFDPDSLIRLDLLPQAGQTDKRKIKYSIIENQVVRLKNGYIGLAF